MAQQKVHTYGRKMVGLRKIATLTKGMGIAGSSYHIQIAWEPDTGKVMYEEFVGPVGDPQYCWHYGVIPCGYIDHPMTQQEIADQITRVLNRWIDPSYLVDESKYPAMPD